ncbi:PAS domain S-box protein [Halorarum halophilum]|uniref:histidine kinase n=1 Tax=Halorarum halophilum TaxID=2743090 RepID=A0A7D5GF59_9EURY|nr:ATP-binding protein [Halobaculum halophilum]QLG27450.1 PAS domain S-box protein [Halobaculum halophilum]
MRSLSKSTLLDDLDDLFFVFDERGTCVEWNRATVDVTGYADGELADMTPDEFFEGDDVDRVLDAVAEVLETGGATVEAKLVTVDGERIPYEFKIRHLSRDDGSDVFAGVGRDVTERHRQRKEIENRMRVLREMYEIIADRHRPFTEQVEALLELGRAELDTEYGSLSEIRGDDYVFEVVDADGDEIEPGDVVPLSATNCEIAASNERTLVLRDVARDAPTETDRLGYTDWGVSCYIGAPVFVDEEVYGTFCFYDTEPRDGQFTEWEVTFVELMSRWVSYELQRQQANERLRRQNEKLERFAAIVSHDLRNPLNVLEGRLELVEETGDPVHFEHCHWAVERMNTLIGDLLTLARAGAVIDETEFVELESIVKRCWGNVPATEATLRVETERTIRADGTRLQQLLENLIRNAVEHVGDTVTVTVGDLPDGFYVADDGPGIPPEERERAFESGYTTLSDGTGFGLPIVREIAEAHGWTVRLTDGPEGGARFEFTGVST